MFGLASVSSAAALSDTLYWGTGSYWWFRPTMLGLASLFVIIGLVMYFRNRGICTLDDVCLLYTSPSPRDATLSRMPSSA